MELELDFTHENELLMNTDWSKLQTKILNFLVVLRNIVERGVHTAHYTKSDLEELKKIGTDTDVLPTSFSFLHIQNPSDERAISKEDIYALLKSPNIGAAVYVCVKASLVFCRYTIEEYTGLNDDYLLDVVDKTATCLVTFETTDAIRMDATRGLLEEFVVYLLEKVASLDSTIFAAQISNQDIFIDTLSSYVALDKARVWECTKQRHQKSNFQLILAYLCFQPEFYSLLWVLLRKLVNIPSVQAVTMKTLTEYFSRLRNYMTDKGLVKMEAFTSEAFGSFLYVLSEMLKVTSDDSLLILSLDESVSNKAEKMALRMVLLDIKKFTPDYMSCTVENIVEKIALDLFDI